MTSTSSPHPLLSRAHHFIGGAWVAPQGGEHRDIENPSTGETVGALAAGDAADVASAVAAAQTAMRNSRRREWSPAARQQALWDLSIAVEKNAEELALLETIEGGKPIANARRIDVPGSVAALRYFGGWSTKLAGETVEMSTPGNWHGHVRRVPVGVVGQINPWNFPLMGAALKIGPAIAAGCATVLKPAEQTSLSSLRLAELAMECGFPAGFVNVVTGTGPAAGAALVDDASVAKISFTGSTDTGRQIAAACGRSLKRCTMELGGKSPVIVLPDADLEAAARGIAMSIFFNSGQTCSAGSRLFAHVSIIDPLVEQIAAIAHTMQIGPAHDPATQIGPLISARQQQRVVRFVDGAIAAGARRVRGGAPYNGNGHFVSPAVLTEVNRTMPAVTEEIFGPVLCAFPFETDDLEEIAAMANDTRYGLAAYVWTRNLTSAFGLIDRLEVGTVRINSGGGADFALPAGGMKQSGFGRENGRAGVEAYTELKTVTVAY